MNRPLIAAQLAVRKAMKAIWPGDANGQSVVVIIENHTRLQAAYIEHRVDDQIEYLLDRLDVFERNLGVLNEALKVYASCSDGHASDAARVRDEMEG